MSNISPPRSRATPKIMVKEQLLKPLLFRKRTSCSDLVWDDTPFQKAELIPNNIKK